MKSIPDLITEMNFLSYEMEKNIERRRKLTAELKLLEDDSKKLVKEYNIVRNFLDLKRKEEEENHV